MLKSAKVQSRRELRSVAAAALGTVSHRRPDSMLETVATHSRLISKVALWLQSCFSAKQDFTLAENDIVGDD